MAIRRIIAVACIITSLFLGLGIYLGSRPHDLFLHDVIRRLGLANSLGRLSIDIDRWFPSWFTNSITNALWMFALTLAIILIWNFELHKASRLWLGAALVVGLFFESVQILIPRLGSFDWVDCVFIGTGWFLGVLVFLPWRNGGHRVT